MSRSTAIPYAVVCLMLIFGFTGCSAVDQIVDNEVSKAVAEENKKLPVDLGDGIELNRLVYEPAINQLNIIYTVSDRSFFENNVRKIETETHKRTREDASLARAMKNGVRIFHDFCPAKAIEGDIGAGKPFTSFETTK